MRNQIQNMDPSEHQAHSVKYIITKMRFFGVTFFVSVACGEMGGVEGYFSSFATLRTALEADSKTQPWRFQDGNAGDCLAFPGLLFRLCAEYA
jgi:hypothetical protein